MIEFSDYIAEALDNELDEAIKVKYVIRGKKKVKKFKTNRKGYRVEYVKLPNGQKKPKEVRITAKEKRNRKIGQRKGKIKRKAKERLIELNRKKSFRARKNMGIKYNKKIPDKVTARLDGTEPKKLKVPKPNISGEKLLSPKFESFCSHFQDYMNEALLNESPWSDPLWVDTTKGIEIAWDWCAEATENGDWLYELVSLYKYGTMDSLRSDRNQNSNFDGTITTPHLYFDKAQIEDITDTLSNDLMFIIQAKYDYKLIKDEKLKSELDKYVPSRLLNKLKG